MSRVVARYFLFVDCLSLCCALLSVLLRAVVVEVAVFCRLLECLRVPCPSPLCCLTCWLLGGSDVFFLYLFLFAVLLSLTPPCARSKRHRVCRHHAHVCFNVSHHTPHRSHTTTQDTRHNTQHTTTHHNTPQQHTEIETEKEDREREREEKMKDEREDQRREDKFKRLKKKNKMKEKRREI